jgi:hypothetical protein
MQSSLWKLRFSWVTFWKQEEFGTFAKPWSIFTSPINVTLHSMAFSAHRFIFGLFSQPLDCIANYYGEDVAFYFAWLSFYTKWLTAPALLGLIAFCFQVCIYVTIYYDSIILLYLKYYDCFITIL